MPHSAQTKTTDLPRKIGRPSEFKAEYCDKVLELGAQGKSRVQISAVIDVTMATLANWERQFPEFLTAMLRARELSQAWWEQKGQDGVDRGSDFNANAYSLQVRNRFPQDWKDKQDLEVTGAGGGPIQLEAMSVEQIRAELAKRGALRAEVLTPQETIKQLTDTTTGGVVDVEAESSDAKP